jgi:Ca2+-transporting ATPase
MSCVWKSKGNRGYVIAAKGAPEAVADLCHLDEERWKALTKEISLLAGAGLRVLGVARAFFVDASLPQGQHDFHFEFLGLLGFADPLRPEVADAIRECYDAGVRVVMITGDYPGTARNVANQISLTSEDIITGSELDKMNEAELQSRIGKVNIFARVVPEQKLQIVNALKATGEVVAMTGDGVNDAPALKAAHIGIAMGSRGTDVARESSALVLLDDDFHSIVQAIRTGRRIFDNLKKAVAYIFAVHVPIAGLSIVPVIMKWPLLFFPVHIVFLELIIDPACSIVFEAEAEEADVMKRPPRGVGERLFDATTIGMSILQGLVVFFAVLTVYVLAVYRGQGEEDARTVSFATLIIANLCLIMVNRSWTRTILETMRTPNAALWWVLSGAVFFLGLVIYVPVLRDLFRFSTLHAIDIGTAFLMGLAGILWFEGMKVVRKKKRW